MAWTSSSNLASIWYSEKKHILTVMFKGGRAYRYKGVQKTVYMALKCAPSKGRYFYYNIRDKYAYVRVR